ncbi:ubiquinone biosynthesis regulatory protein kinase UbiB [Methylotenera versatilis]|uniref:ubiquinone biosynthesis regulatory protein kinase UbiB n=1 Tax=Methylotenera versatilis TaxID=1055487 RepID=UPI000645B82B|nr:ubiquinone biosynthesis regulatory protein kinase UbiB [Methylotenera versatilis]
MHYFRLFVIIFTLLKFGLDEFISEHVTFKPLHTLIKCVFFWRSTTLPRGVRLRLALEKLGPLFVKFGQMLSTRRDLLPSDVADELAKLQDQVPPFEFAEVQKSIETAFCLPLNQIYSQFEPVAIASASVAQVHFAHLIDGQEVAVKVLRPGIAKVISQDLLLLKSLARLLQTVSSEGKRLKPLEVVDEFARHTKHELDLTLEAANCSQLARNFAKKDEVRARLLIPDVYWDYCRKEVMTMQRMHGIPISQIDVLRANGIDITKLAHDGVEIFFTQVFRDGFFHADMHPGNIQVANDGLDKGKYIALDFGIMGSLSDIDKYYLARNFLAFFNRDYRDVAVAHIESGWVPQDTNIEELETAVRAICEPIFDKPLKDISFGRTLLSLFQMSRRFGVVIQPQLVMLQKTLLNIEGLGRDLDPNIDLWQTAKPFLNRWMSEQVGWRSIANTFKKELPFILKNTPQMPRLVHQFLTQQTLAEQNIPAHKTINILIKIQKNQARWQKWMVIAIVVLVLLQSVSLTIILFK